MEQRTPVGTETISNTTPRISKYFYDFGGRLVKEIYPSGREVKNEFESDGDLMRVFGKANASSPEKTYVNSFSYTASGGISRMKLGNGKWETAKFNDRQQITELGLGNSATDASIWKVNYEYGEVDANGNIITAKNTGNIARQTLSFAGLTNPIVQTYKYDSVYRLTEAKETSNSTQNWIQTYNYDRYGNRIGFNENIGGIGNTQTPAINPLTNRFTSTNFTYDKNGNIIHDVSKTNQARDFVFNAENKQIEIKDANNLIIGKYYYDGEGKRVKKVTDTETTVFVYSGGKLVAEYSTQLSQNPTTSYTTTDHLGTPRVITDALGQVKARRDFMPFGEELTINVGARSTNLKYGTNADDVRQKFTGYQKDTETELDFAEARMYENRYARFTAVDPLMASGQSANPQTFNRFIYVGNNPIVFTDPSGLCRKGESVYYTGETGSRNFTCAKEAPSGQHTAVTGEMRINANDGYTYLVRPGGMTSIGKTKSAPSYPLMAPSVALTPGDVRQPFWDLANGFDQALNGAVIGAAKGTANTLIDGANGEISSFFDRTGLSFAMDAPQFGRYRYNNSYENKYGNSFQTGFTLAPMLFGGIGGGSGGSSFSVVPRSFSRRLPCFKAGTLIHTNQGLVKIENIKKGDFVLSWNKTTKQNELKQVVRTFTKNVNTIVTLYLTNESQPIFTTENHPFYALQNSNNRNSGQWKEAKELKAEDLLLSSDGTWTKVKNITIQKQTVQVYNFEVADNHNYYVSEKGILVHNDCTDEALKIQKELGGGGSIVRITQNLPNGERASWLEKPRGFYQPYYSNKAWGHHDVLIRKGLVYDKYSNFGTKPIPFKEWFNAWKLEPINAADKSRTILQKINP